MAPPQPLRLEDCTPDVHPSRDEDIVAMEKGIITTGLPLDAEDSAA